MTTLTSEEQKYAHIAEAAYNKNGKMKVNDVVKIEGVEYEIIASVDKDSGNTNGLQAYALKKVDSNEIVVAVAGSQMDDLAKDWRTSDFQIALDIVPNQIKDAKEFVDTVRKAYPGCTISLSGHSLGGGVVEAIGALAENKDMKTYSYNAIGTKHILNDLAKQNEYEISSDHSNITSYIVDSDIVARVCEHVGDNIVMLDNGKSFIFALGNHSLKNFYDGRLTVTQVQNLKTIEDIVSFARIIPTLNILVEYPTEKVGKFFNAMLGISPCEAAEIQNVESLFDQALATEPYRRDPLLVDLDGGGIQTTNLGNGIYFDHDNNGFAESSAWVGSGDGIFVFDKNANGTIDKGNEIFGDNYTKSNGTKASSGFDALADFDSNGDRIVNSSDAEFASIRILKGDGTLLSLEEAGIVSIALNFASSNVVDENGNTQLRVGSYTRNDGTVQVVGDYNFVTNPLYSVANEFVAVSDEIALLPDISGYGLVDSLHQAMAKDLTGELRGLIEAFIDTENPTDKRALLNGIVLKWAGVGDIASDSRGQFIDARALAVLEKFTAKNFLGVGNSTSPNAQAAPFANAAFENLKEYVYAQLTSQTSFKHLYDLITVEVDVNSGELSLNLSRATEYIMGVILEDKDLGESLLADFDKTFKNLGLKDISNYGEYYDAFVEMDGEYKTLFLTSDKVAIYGTAGNNAIEGSALEEAFFAGAGDDTIFTRQGNDIVYGGAGNDSIDTCEGNDIVYGGDGNDTILGGNGSDLIYGEAGDDSINAGQANDTIYGGAGNDTIDGVNNSNYIDGGEGNDLLIAGGLGKSTLIGGLGDDTLHGQNTTYNNNNASTTTFIYNAGDGHDTFYRGRGNNEFIFGEGITKDNMRFEAIGNDLKITFVGIEGSLMLPGARSALNYADIFKFADGTTLTGPDANLLYVKYGTENDDIIAGSDSAETIYGYAGDDSINAGQANDTIYGGAGNDIIDGVRGNNYIDAGEGNDFISAGDGGYSTLIGGLGNDTIYGHTIINSVNKPSQTTFIYNLGDGDDIIFSQQHQIETFSFGDGISKDNIMYTAMKNNDIIITFKDKEGSLTLKNGLLNFNTGKGTIIFADGTSTNWLDIRNRLVWHGTEESDTVIGSNDPEKFYGYAGDDSIIGGWENDTIYGGAGNDTIDGSRGNDYIDAGAGNDSILAGAFGVSTLIGGLGDDTLTGESTNYASNETTYIYNLGDGNDTIFTNSYNAEKFSFGEGISKDNIVLKLMDNNDILMTFTDHEGSIIFKAGLNNFKLNPNDLFLFADGTALNGNDIRGLYVKYGTDSDDIIVGTNETETIWGKDGNDSITGNNGNDTIYGGAGNDTIDGSSGNDYLDGGAGNDVIKTSYGDVTIVGGLGDDTLSGHYASDLTNKTTFVYNLGDGNDTITPGNGTCVISLGEGITKDNLRYSSVDKDLVISFSNSEGSINLKNWTIYQQDAKKIILSDGTLVSNDEIMNSLQTHGTEGDDTLIGSDRNEIIYGYGGNDLIRANLGNDTIYGGDGNDTIYAGQGSNLIYGGAGDDNIVDSDYGSSIITGGLGNDTITGNGSGYNKETTTYIYNLGDGNDTIIGRGGKNILDFGEGITKDNINFTQVGKDLVISFQNEAGSVTIQNGVDSLMLNTINFADGSSYTQIEMLEKTVLYGTEGNDSIVATNDTRVILGLGGDDYIKGNSYNNTIYGGDGNDTIDGKDGSNYIYGDEGNDVIRAGASGQSTLVGGLGDDTLYGQDNYYGTIVTTYVYNPGDGNDVINYGSGDNNVNLGGEFNKQNTRFEIAGKDLIIKFEGQDGSIKLVEGSGSDRLTSVNFADGTSYTGSEVKEIARSASAALMSNELTTFVSSSQINQLIQDITAYANNDDMQISCADNAPIN